VGQDKGSLTEQQAKGNSNNNDTDKGKTQHKPHDPESRPPQPPPHAPKPQVSSHPQLPPIGTQRDGTWYGIPCSVWPGGVSPPGCAPSWSLVKINPVLAEPRTIPQAGKTLSGSELKASIYVLTSLVIWFCYAPVPQMVFRRSVHVSFPERCHIFPLSFLTGEFLLLSSKSYSRAFCSCTVLSVLKNVSLYLSCSSCWFPRLMQ